MISIKQRILVSLLASVSMLSVHAQAPAQQARLQGSPLDAGVRGAAYGRCDRNAMDLEALRFAAALGAFSRTAIDRMLQPRDEMDAVVGMCAQQVHQHRCAARIIAVVGDVAFSAYPGSAVLPPEPNAGAGVGAVLGTTGFVLGGLLGNHVGGGAGALLGAGAGAYVGAQKGASLLGGAKAVGCVRNQRALDAASSQLGGALATRTVQGLGDFVSRNFQRGALKQDEAQALIDEINKLANGADRVL